MTARLTAVLRPVRVGMAVLAAVLLVGGCADNPTNVAGGGGVETTGGDLIALSGAAPSLAAGARVRLVPEDYIPTPDSAFPDSLTAIADDTGHYTFRKVPKGIYNLEAFLPKDGTRLLRRGLRLDRTTSALGRDTLKAPARLSLRWATAREGIFYVTGTTWARPLTGGETLPLEYLLDSLPSGLQAPLRHRPAPPDSGSRVLTDSLRFEPGGTLRWEVLDDWAHAARLVINTSSTGADVSGDAVDFPLLVRLFAGDFDFAQFSPGGRDLRFTDAEGAPLPYVIQRWDSAGGRAEVWVRVPRVDGNSDTDHVVMHWGRKDASEPPAEAVFDRAGGFTALWHLDEAGTTAPQGFADVLGGHPGTAGAVIDSTFTEALMVGGLKLDGAKHVSVAPARDLDSLPAFTLSAWFKADLWTGGDLTLFQKGSGAGVYGLTEAIDFDSLEFRISVGGTLHVLRTPNVLPEELHLAQATFDGQEARLYVDGALRKSLPLAGALDIASDSLFIGHKPGGQDKDRFRGLLDEVSVSHVARSPHWLKLAYETQKHGSKVVRLEPIR